MFGSEVIEVGIGMAVLFFFMSLIATALCEALENIIKSRAKYLEQGIGEIFRDLPGFIDKFYRHPLIASLYSGTYQPKAQNLPSYIPRQSFSLALLDLLSDSRTGFSIDALKTSLQTSLADDKQDPNPLQKLLLSVIDTAGGDIDKTRKLLEEWYDGTMDASRAGTSAEPAMSWRPSGSRRRLPSTSMRLPWPRGSFATRPCGPQWWSRPKRS